MSGDGRRIAVYCDYPYRCDAGRLSAEQPVALFLAQLRREAALTLVGRLDPTPGSFPYALEGTGFVALPHHSDSSSARSQLRAVPVAARRFWKLLRDVDVVWLFGPAPLSLLFAALAGARGRRVCLGVRQDLPRLFARRHAERPLLRAAADVLEHAYRALSRVSRVAVVGPDLAHNYRHARRLHTMIISLLEETDIVAPDTRRDYDGQELRMLSVGRLDPEKNPRLLADVLAGAVREDPRWRLDVCGDGPEAGALADRLRTLGVADRATLHGVVPIDGGLLELYRAAHAFVHVSFTEGVPQVLLEAFASGLPVVATEVGGVGELAGDAALRIGPADAPAAVRALSRIAGDPELRERLVARGTERARSHTRAAEAAAVAAFLLAD